MLYTYRKTNFGSTSWLRLRRGLLISIPLKYSLETIYFVTMEYCPIPGNGLYIDNLNAFPGLEVCDSASKYYLIIETYNNISSSLFPLQRVLNVWHFILFGRQNLHHFIVMQRGDPFMDMIFSNYTYSEKKCEWYHMVMRDYTLFLWSVWTLSYYKYNAKMYIYIDSTMSHTIPVRQRLQSGTLCKDVKSGRLISTQHIILLMRKYFGAI